MTLLRLTEQRDNHVLSHAVIVGISPNRYQWAIFLAVNIKQSLDCAVALNLKLSNRMLEQTGNMARVRFPMRYERAARCSVTIGLVMGVLKSWAQLSIGWYKGGHDALCCEENQSES
jgi:hypothetical protein